MKVKLSLGLFTVLTVLMAVSGPAQANLIDQTYGTGAGSFELGTYQFGSAIANGTGFFWTQPNNSSTITGWVTGDNVNWNFQRWQNSAGSYDVELGANTLLASISTVLNLTPGEYTVSFGLSSTPSFNPGTVEVSMGSANQFFTNSATTSTADMQWTTHSLTFNAPTSGNYTLTFASVSGTIPVIDDVKVVATPEPSTWALLAMSVVALFVLGRGKMVRKLK